MLVRLWYAGFTEADKEKLVQYAAETSLPVLSSRAGNCGVSFLSSGDEWIEVTYWQDQESIDKLADDPEYVRVVEGLVALGVLGKDQKTTIWNCEGRFIDPVTAALSCDLGSLFISDDHLAERCT